MNCDNCEHDVSHLRSCPHDPDCSLRICDRCFRTVQSKHRGGLMTAPRWIVKDDDWLVWNDDALGSADVAIMALEGRPREHDAHRALVDTVRHHDGLTACLRRYLAGWVLLKIAGEFRWAPRDPLDLDDHETVTEAERDALGFLWTEDAADTATPLLCAGCGHPMADHDAMARCPVHPFHGEDVPAGDHTAHEAGQ